MQQSPPSEPRLAPPGAGIPAIERFVGGMIFAIKRWRGTRERFAADFVRERAAINALYSPLNSSSLTTRVLIPRLRGLEDSSRFWSVAMTLDHLRIVNDSIAGVIESLANGIVPPGEASTAAVKPSASAEASVVLTYERSCDRLIEVAAAAKSLNMPARYAHPWFGPLNAHGWQAMAGMHMGIHRAQIERILRDMPRGSA